MYGVSVKVSPGKTIDLPMSILGFLELIVREQKPDGFKSLFLVQKLGHSYDLNWHESEELQNRICQKWRRDGLITWDKHKKLWNWV